MSFNNVATMKKILKERNLELNQSKINIKVAVTQNLPNLIKVNQVIHNGSARSDSLRVQFIMVSYLISANMLTDQPTD